MKKYKLIKCYPGSPELGTEVEKELNSKSNSSYFYRSGDRRICVLNHHVEDSPEYWEEVEDNIWWIVFKNAETMFHSWTPYRLESTLLYHKGDTREYFKTEEEAKTFIIFNKPCLSYNDVKEEIKCRVSQYETLNCIYQIVKSKL